MVADFCLLVSPLCLDNIVKYVIWHQEHDQREETAGYSNMSASLSMNEVWVFYSFGNVFYVHLGGVFIVNNHVSTVLCKNVF